MDKKGDELPMDTKPKDYDNAYDDVINGKSFTFASMDIKQITCGLDDAITSADMEKDVVIVCTGPININIHTDEKIQSKPEENAYEFIDSSTSYTKQYFAGGDPSTKVDHVYYKEYQKTKTSKRNYEVKTKFNTSIRIGKKAEKSRSGQILSYSLGIIIGMSLSLIFLFAAYCTYSIRC